MPTAGDPNVEDEEKKSENVTGNNKISVIQTDDMKTTELKEISNMKFTRSMKQKKKPMLDMSVDSDLTENILDKSNEMDERKYLFCLY